MRWGPHHSSKSVACQCQTYQRSDRPRTTATLLDTVEAIERIVSEYRARAIGSGRDAPMLPRREIVSDGSRRDDAGVGNASPRTVRTRHRISWDGGQSLPRLLGGKPHGTALQWSRDGRLPARYPCHGTGLIFARYRRMGRSTYPRSTVCAMDAATARMWLNEDQASAWDEALAARGATRHRADELSGAAETRCPVLDPRTKSRRGNISRGSEGRDIATVRVADQSPQRSFPPEIQQLLTRP